MGLHRHSTVKFETAQKICTWRLSISFLCNYAATHLANLKQHKASVHDGVKYPCDQCAYAATQISSLNLHKESVHEKINYTCDLCEYTAKKYSTLSYNKKVKHTLNYKKTVRRKRKGTKESAIKLNPEVE